MASEIIGLVDVDGKYPNLALMKISTYYRRMHTKVGWYNPLLDPVPTKLYASKIFKFTPDYQYYPDTEIIKGGTGYDLKIKLPMEIEACPPDYSIYPSCDFSLQRYSTGCIRQCKHCVVGEKEGHIYPSLPMPLNPIGEWIYLLDNNLFANPLWRESLEHLHRCNQPVCFEGIDVRIITEEQARMLKKFKLYKQIHIAWDNPNEKLLPKLKKIIKSIPAYKLMCYVLIGFDSTPEQDLYRVMKLSEMGIDPFVMPFNKDNQYENDFARWVNDKAIFKTVLWKNYKSGKKKPSKQQDEFSI